MNGTRTLLVFMSASVLACSAAKPEATEDPTSEADPSIDTPLGSVDSGPTGSTAKKDATAAAKGSDGSAVVPKAGDGAGGGPAYQPSGGCLSNSAEQIRICNAKLGVTLKYSGINPNDGWKASSEQQVDEMLANAVRGNGYFHIVKAGATPFDGHTIDEVKANPNVLDWNAVANFFKGEEGWLKWQDKAPGRVYIGSLRWFRHLVQTPDCSAGEYVLAKGNAIDEASYWVSIFAWAYWANVKNQYDLKYIEVSNEPDNCNGGWGTQQKIADHTRLIELTKDAFQYVNGTLVSPPKPATIVGPGLLSYYNGKAWFTDIMETPTAKAALDLGSFHSYYGEHWWEELSGGAKFQSTAMGGKKQWITEWGAFWYQDGYSNPLVVHGMAPLLLTMGLWKIEFSTPWSLEDYEPTCCKNGYVGKDGTKTRMYWLTRLLNRAILSEKDLLETSYANEQTDVNFAFATRDASDLYVVLMNQGDAVMKAAVDVSAFPNAEGKAVTLDSVGDASAGEQERLAGTVASGKFAFEAAADTYYVARVAGGGAP
jgi:hypothetical protein